MKIRDLINIGSSENYSRLILNALIANFYTGFGIFQVSSLK